MCQNRLRQSMVEYDNLECFRAIFRLMLFNRLLRQTVLTCRNNQYLFEIKTLK